MVDIDEFMALFAGRTDAHGYGRGGVHRRSATVVEFIEHLEGNHPDGGLGIFPLLDDGTVRFAAIDLDEPDFEFARDLQDFLPGQTWIEKSRSGNAHIWAFFTEPVEAWIPRGIMLKALEALGRRDVEVFPKQDSLPDGLIGNYINLPFYGETRPILEYSITGEVALEMTVKEFLPQAKKNLIDPEDWRRRAAALDIVAPDKREHTLEHGTLAELHACASHIIRNKETNPIVPGNRSVVLFSLSKMLTNWREVDDREAMEYVREVNDAAPDPVSESELERIFANAASGRFSSTGCSDPLMADYILPDCPFGGHHS